MALIDCPYCKKRTSNISQKCMHCGSPLNEKDSDIAIERLNRARKRESAYRIQFHAYLSILLVVFGVFWYWLDSEQLTRSPGDGPVYAISLGVVWYLALRASLIFRKILRSGKGK